MCAMHWLATGEMMMDVEAIHWLCPKLVCCMVVVVCFECYGRLVCGVAMGRKEVGTKGGRQ